MTVEDLFEIDLSNHRFVPAISHWHRDFNGTELMTKPWSQTLAEIIRTTPCAISGPFYQQR